MSGLGGHNKFVPIIFARHALSTQVRAQRGVGVLGRGGLEYLKEAAINKIEYEATH